MKKKKNQKQRPSSYVFELFFQDFGYNTHHRVANKKSTQNHRNLHFISRTAYKLQLLPSCNNINKIQTFPIHNYMALGTTNKPMKKKSKTKQNQRRHFWWFKMRLTYNNTRIQAHKTQYKSYKLNAKKVCKIKNHIVLEFQIIKSDLKLHNLRL